MCFFVVETESRGSLLLQLDLRSHLSRPHCKFGYVLQSFTGRDLTARSLHLASFAEVVNYLEWGGLFSFCLHAFEQIILIAISEDHSMGQSKTQMLVTLNHRERLALCALGKLKGKMVINMIIGNK